MELKALLESLPQIETKQLDVVGCAHEVAYADDYDQSDLELISPAFHHDVLGFQVQVDDAALVYVVDSLQHLHHEVFTFLLCKIIIAGTNPGK